MDVQLKIEKQKDLIQLSAKYLALGHQESTLQTMCEDLKKIIGAKYVAFNLWISEKKITKTIAISGDIKTIQKADKLFGFRLLGKEWKLDGFTQKILRSRKIITPGLAHNGNEPALIPQKKKILSQFGMSNIYGVGLFYERKPVGTLVMIMSDGKKIEAPEIAESFAEFVGSSLFKLKNEWLTKEEIIRNQHLLDETSIIAQIGRWELDLNTRKLYWSEPLYSIFEMRQKKGAVDQSAVLKMIHPEDRKFVQKTYRNAVVKKGNYEIQYRLLLKSKKEKWVLERGHCELNGQNIQKLVGIVQEITPLKETEDHLKKTQKILEQASEIGKFGGWEILPANQKLYWSDLTKKIHEVDSDYVPTVEKALSFYVGADNQEKMKKVCTNALEHGLAFDEEMQIITAKNNLRWIRIVGHAEVENGICQRVFGLYRDVTDQKKIENDLVAAKLEAEKSNRAKSDFLSSMSHELRTPLNAIMGFSQLLQMSENTNLTSDELENVDEILKAGRHLLTLINQVLDLTKIEIGQVEISIQNIKLFPVVTEVVKSLNFSASKKNIQIEVFQRKLKTVLISADHIRLKQILMNLVSNAVKYNAEGGEVKIYSQNVSNDSVRIFVEDNGRGIPATKVDKLFQPFQRLGAELTDIEGTGIGLTISKQLCELMGGSIGYQKPKGSGSIFWIEFPLVKTKRVYLKKKTKIPVIRNKTSYSPNNHRTILYVEDNPANLKIMKQFFEGFPNLRLLTAINGFLALDIAEKNPIDLFMIDISLPDLNGFQILEKLRIQNAYREKPIFAVSASVMPSEVEKGKKLGFSEYIEKPIIFEKLNLIMDKYL